MVNNQIDVYTTVEGIRAIGVLGSCLYVRTGHFGSRNYIHTATENVNHIVSSPVYWDNVSQAVLSFSSVCKAIGPSKTKTATMATALPCLLYVRVHIRQGRWLNSKQKKELDGNFQTQPLRVLTEVQCLAMHCNPMYDGCITSSQRSLAALCFLSMTPQ